MFIALQHSIYKMVMVAPPVGKTAFINRFPIYFLKLITGPTRSKPYIDVISCISAGSKGFAAGISNDPNIRGGNYSVMDFPQFTIWP